MRVIDGWLQSELVLRWVALAAGLYWLGIVAAVCDVFVTHTTRLRQGTNDFSLGGYAFALLGWVLCPGCCSFAAPQPAWAIAPAKLLDLVVLLAAYCATEWLLPIWVRERLRRRGQLGCEVAMAVFLPPWSRLGRGADARRQRAIAAEAARRG